MIYYSEKIPFNNHEAQNSNSKSNNNSCPFYDKNSNIRTAKPTLVHMLVDISSFSILINM